MNDWPIIKQFVSILSYAVRGLYILLQNMGIESVVVTIAVFAVITKLCLFPILYKQQELPFLRNIAKKDIDKINSTLKDDKAKLSIETFRVYSKYGIANNTGCLLSIFQIIDLIALYSIVFDAAKYIPEAANNSNAFVFFGLDMNTAPEIGSITTLIIPFIAVITQFISTFQINYYNSGRKNIGFLNIYSSGITLIFSLQLPCIIAFYWSVQAIVTIIENLIIRTILNNRGPEKAMLLHLQKLNKSRTKRELSEITIFDLQGTQS